MRSGGRKKSRGPETDTLFGFIFPVKKKKVGVVKSLGLVVGKGLVRRASSEKGFRVGPEEEKGGGED